MTRIRFIFRLDIPGDGEIQTSKRFILCSNKNEIQEIVAEKEALLNPVKQMETLSTIANLEPEELA